MKLGDLLICSNKTTAEIVPTAAPVPAKNKKNLALGSIGLGGLPG